MLMNINVGLKRARTDYIYHSNLLLPRFSVFWSMFMVMRSFLFLSWFHSLVVLHAVVALKLALRDGMYFRVISLASVTYVKYAGMIFTMRQFFHDPLFLINLNKYLSWYLLSGSPDIWLYHDLRLIKARARPTNRPLIYGFFFDDIACVDAFLI